MRFVRSPPQILEMFRQAMNMVKMMCKAKICLDCPTRWNSTFIMLNIALKFKAFATMVEDEKVHSWLTLRKLKMKMGVIIACQTKGRKMLDHQRKIGGRWEFLSSFYGWSMI